MSPSNYSTEKLNRNEAKKQIQFIVCKHLENIWFSKHALKELSNDDLTTVDALNVLKSPDSKIYDEGELERGNYRYRLETANIIVVITFSADGKSITVITTWDKRRK